MEKAAGKLIEIFNSNWSSEEMMNTLKRKLGELTAIEDDINIQLESAESSSSNKKRKRQVAYWLANVGSVKQEIQNLEAGLKRSNWCNSGVARVKGLLDEVDELIGKSRFQGGLVLEVCETKTEPLLVTKLFGQAFENNLRKVWEWLTKDEVLRIGIYGMGGVGKTTLVSHIYNQILERENTFKNVYWITISQDFSIRKLQDCIANIIQFDLGSEDEEKIRAAKLSKALQKKQRSVFILDDLWNQFFLEEVGIPMSCKLIITTRSLDICRIMSCHEMMKLEPLLKEESWNLFVEKLGNYAILSSEVEEIAKSVVRECDGLPLGIVTLAGSMRGVDDLKEWRSVLEQLKQSIIEPGEMDEKVFKVLNVSYERLRDPALQKCFLYCALFPEDCEISREELIEYLISEDIIKDLNSRQAQLDRGHTMLNKLKNACLLEACLSGYNVKLHDLIRDMAINKMKGNSKAMVKAGERLKEVPNEIEWPKDLVRVSLIENNIKKITWGHSPSCPNLLTLLLRDNKDLKFIADSFFLQFCGLKVLDLSCTDIKKLPNSVSNLVSLTSLLLCDCHRLRYIPSLAKMKSLKKLDLSQCAGVEKVPRGLKLLSNLQYLDMDETGIEEIPNGLLPNLSHVQYLRLDWSTAVKVKSACLEKVENLKCRFPKPQDFNGMMKDYLVGPLLSFCNILIGETCSIENGFQLLNKLVVYNGCNIGKEGDLVGIPMDVDLDLLLISECHTSRSLDNASLLDGAGEVRVKRCEGLEYLISLYRLSSSPTIFDHVVELKLEDLNNLQVLFSREGAPPPSFRSDGVFCSLTCFSIEKCPSITSLFPSELLPNLQNLEKITVAFCEKIEQIISEASNSGSHAEFISLPRLRSLEFRDLPKLKSICSKKMACDSMKTIDIFDCPKLKRMSLSLIQQLDNGQLSPLPSLKKISIRPTEWWDSVKLDHPNAKDVLQPLLQLIPEWRINIPNRIKAMEKVELVILE